MKKLFLLIFCMIAAVQVYAAPDGGGYVPLIREGRVWEYHYTDYYTYEYMIQFHFDGTEILDGKEYHLFKPFRQFEFRNPEEPEHVKEVGIDRDRWPVSYLREEGGKVYRYIKEGVIRKLRNGTDETEIENEEYVVMDFTLQKGESASLFSLLYPFDQDICNFYLCDYEITDVSEETVENETCRSLTYRLDEYAEFKIVEGIGIMGGHGGTLDGFIANFEMNMWPPSLNNVYDLEGNVIYAGESIVLPEPEYVPLIREDRVWEYYSIDHITYGNMVQYHFDGMETLDGKEYHLFKPFRQFSFFYDGDPSNIEEVGVDYDRWPVSYLREDNGKVYRYIREGEVSPFGSGSTQTEIDGEEYLIFDFTVQKDETVGLLTTEYPFNPVFHPCDFLVKDVSEVTIQDEACRSITFENNMLPTECLVIEGIGPTQYGTIDGISVDFTMNDVPPALNNVYDLEGNVIYAGEGINIPNAVNDVTDDLIGMTYAGGAVRATGDGSLRLAIYDMTGRAVATATGDGEVSLSTDSLAPGVYTAVCRSASGSATTVLMTGNR